jgi:rod shape-determining protein MreD
MSRVRPYVVLALVFWIAAALEQAAAPSMAVSGARPDLLLVVALTAAVFFEPVWAALIGFLAGAMYGGVSGSDTARYSISYTLVAYGAGYVSRLELDVRPWYVALVVVGGTVLARLLMMIPAPPPEVWPYLRDTIFAAMYNGVLAVPLYVFLRRALRPKVS